MNRKTIAAVLLAAGTALAMPALAQMGPGGMMNDPDGEATITRAEADAKAAEQFARLDADKDGFVTQEEMAAMRQAMGRRAGAPQGGAAGAPPPGAPPADGAPPPADGARRGPGGPGGPGGGMMRMMDANGDGKISKDEFVAALGRRFDQMDDNKDGKVTKQERTDFMEDMRARMMMRGQGN